MSPLRNGLSRWMFSLSAAFGILLGPTVNLFAGWQKTSSFQPIRLPSEAYFQEAEAQLGEAKVRIYAVIFNEKKCRLRILDNPASEAKDLQTTLRCGGYFAGVNGGYFHETFKPVGLVISNGRVLHPVENARLLSGVLEVRKSSIRLVRSNQFRHSKDTREALQAGPYLLENGKLIRGLNEIRMARRTIVASDDAGNWALISMSPVTLAQAAAVLGTPGLFPEWRPWCALNLDGGSSSAFWADKRPKPIAIHEWGVVRNFLGLGSLP